MKRTLMSCAVASLLVSGSGAGCMAKKTNPNHLSLGRGRKYRYCCTPGAEGLQKS